MNLSESNLGGSEKLYLINGKSKLLKTRILKALAKYAGEKELDTEYIVSPYNNSYVDGVIIRDKNAAIFDSDCINEGEKCDIVDTDGFLSDNKLEKYEKLQSELYKKSQDAVSGLFSAYKGAKLVHDEWEQIYIRNIDFNRLERYEEGLLESLIKERSVNLNFEVRERFFGASTPDGSVNFIENLTDNLKKRYFIKGRPGTGKSTFLKKLSKKAKEYGYTHEVYYCSFDKNSLDMVVIPELSFCVFDSTAPHELFPQREGDSVLDFYNESGLCGIDEKYEKQLSEIKRLYTFRISEGIAKLRLYSGYDKEREYYFESAADFELADKMTDKIARKILI